MTARSQNGWPVIEPDAADIMCRDWIIPGNARTLRLLPGPTGFVLAHWVLWFDRNIENIDEGFDDWGYSYRAIGGSDEWSNHASATAVDLNAERHPQGVRDTFDPDVRDKILDALERRYLSVIKPGMSFRTTVDDMHFELVAGRTAVRELAVALYNTPIGKRLRERNPAFKWAPEKVT